MRAGAGGRGAISSLLPCRMWDQVGPMASPSTAYPRAFCCLRSSAQRPHVVVRLSRLTVSRPCLHERSALLQSIRAPVSLLGLVADHMSERGFGDLSREVRLIAGPIAKGAPESVNRSVGNSKTGQNLRHGDV